MPTPLPSSFLDLDSAKNSAWGSSNTKPGVHFEQPDMQDRFLMTNHARNLSPPITRVVICLVPPVICLVPPVILVYQWHAEMHDRFILHHLRDVSPPPPPPPNPASKPPYTPLFQSTDALFVATPRSIAPHVTLLARLCILLQLTEASSIPAYIGCGPLGCCFHTCNTYGIPPYKRWGWVAELTCHLQGSTPSGIRFSHKTTSPTRDVT
jgi:hypothetical protein